VQPAAGCGDDDADELGVDAGGRALTLEQLVGGVVLLVEHAGGGGVHGVQRTAAHMGERETGAGASELPGQRDRAGAVGRSVDADENVVVHARS
jgi:hypothetical protein